MLTKIDLLVLNDSEAKLFMETNNIIVAGKKLLELGPSNVVIKTGEHGALLFGKGEIDFLPLWRLPARRRRRSDWRWRLFSRRVRRAPRLAEAQAGVR